MASTEEKPIHAILLYIGLFLAVLVFVAAIVLLLFNMPTPGGDASGRKITIISAHEKMVVSVLVHTTLVIIISSLSGAVIVLLIYIIRRLDRMTNRLQALTRILESGVSNAVQKQASNQEPL